MTTATDWDVTDTETGEHPVVTDVTSAATPDAPIEEYEHAHILRQLNTELAGQAGALSAEVLNLQAENRRLQAELDRRGWLPTPEQMGDARQRDIRGAGDLTETEYNAGLYRPAELDDVDKDGMPLHPAGSSGTWPTWLGDLHHADATLAEQINGVRSWADSYTARPVERTIVQPVEVDDSWRQSEAALYAEMVLEGRDRETGAVLAGPYSELAPDRIQANAPPDNRVDRMVEDPQRYFAEARQRAEREVRAETGDRSDVERMTRRVNAQLRALTPAETETPAPETPQSEPGPPRAGGWRVWAASAAIGIVGLAATIGALAVRA